MSLGKVKKHLEHIFHKLGVESRTVLAARTLAEAVA
jgi:DNA-binding CsgD family transcriptional regulator